MNSRTHENAQHDIVSVLPDRAHDLARLRELATRGEPIVTVIGKYNHGKSRLLNELVGRDIFAVADKRETVELSEWLHQGVRWLDAPGLDADVGTEDDRHALRAAWLKSDIRLFVHTAKEGELDAKELALLEELRADGLRTRRQILFVLSQIDQLADEGELGKVRAAINAQAVTTAVHAVSATRHRQGIESAKNMLVERSGIPSLRTLLETMLGLVPDARTHEARLLSGEIREELEQLHARQQQTLESLRRNQVQQRQSFDDGLDAVLHKVGRDIKEVVDAPVADHAVVADTAQDKYNITQAKLERARIQIAYSRACIQIDSFLTGYGVVGLPKEQQVAAGSLNTVMVAVMGVSVKFRSDLRSWFCEAPGHARMQREFTHYFERSKDREALREKIAGTESALAATQRALAALCAMETGA